MQKHEAGKEDWMESKEKWPVGKPPFSGEYSGLEWFPGLETQKSGLAIPIRTGPFQGFAAAPLKNSRGPVGPLLKES